MDKNQELSEAIKRLYEQERISRSRELEIDNLVDRVRSIIHPELQSGDKLQLVGSSSSGFALNTSDIDLNVETNSSYNLNGASYLVRIQAALRSANFVNSWNSELISWAKTPVLKLKVDGLNIDITVTRWPSDSRRNSNLLKAYADLDPRVKPLVVVVKLWAKKNNINNSFRCTLSSYALTLLVIHYLQAGCSVCLLPSLQKLHPNLFESLERYEDVRYKISYLSENTDSLGDLLIGFLDYYTNRFQFGNQVIDISAGTTKPRTYLHASNEYIQIEDPIKKTNASYTVHKSLAFNRIRDAFRTAHNRLSSSRQLSLIM